MSKSILDFEIVDLSEITDNNILATGNENGCGLFLGLCVGDGGCDYALGLCW